GRSRPSSIEGGSARRRTPAPVRRRLSRGRGSRYSWFRSGSHCALAFAAHDLERRLLGPVDEVVHVVQAELDRHREILDPCLELRWPDAVDERVELLALGPRGFVKAYPPIDCLGYALGWE